MLRTRHRLTTHLALLAIVLLATLPTLGRVWSAAPPASPPVTEPQAMHHMPGMAHDMAGMTQVDHDAMATMHAMHQRPAGDAKSPSPSHAAPHPHTGDQHRDHGEGDCDYCPLLHSLLASTGITLLAIDEAALPAPQLRMRSAALPWHYPSGLGSRGPPRAL
jgi:hypothetical protein